MEVENQVPVAVEETTESMEVAPGTESEPKVTPAEPTTPEVKKNGTIVPVVAPSPDGTTPSNSSQQTGYRPNSEKSHTSGIIVQFPEMFSLRRDKHILDKFSNALDVRMQKCAFIECESEEVAARVQAKLNKITMNSKGVNAYRLDLTEKISLYTSNLKKETTDEYIKENYNGALEIMREKFSVFIKFSSEAECRAARTKIVKEGINGQKVHCDFDLKRDRFSKPVEPEPKKLKTEEETTAVTDGAPSTGETEAVKPEEEEEKVEAEATEEGAAEVKADEW